MELLMTRLHEATVLLYAISMLLYFIDFLNNNQKANRVAFWLLSIVWVLQTIFLFLYVLKTGRFPVLTIFEGLYFYAWVLISLSLIINRLLRVDFTVFFTNVLGFMVMAIHTFAPVQIESQVLAQRLVSELLLIHITFAILSYGAFTLSFVFSVLYLIQYDLLKRKKWGKRLLRLGDLTKLEHMSYVLAVIGVPLLVVSLILGIQWAYIKVPGVSWLDMKIIGSFILLIAYSVFLYLKIRKQMYGRTLAFLNIGSFMIVLINFFLFGSLSTFHFWNT
ncbi:cytochrome C assembly family protein [Peribacillus frigoritolerans]|jgi:HemX protein|uniref:Cytochrome c biogenesis protein n=1 Tax=Peribacillus castrilensis TaxID=2897690 RepID=A0AAW9NAL7_9BACI|nr:MULTISPECIES: cytochrome c biogenesis protein [Peribacillus]KOR79886.1 cytochrome C assembly protein [Bacillus sp. FJAT-21352]KOR86429.1 cytochrome C assembly protein [Bacillus sp. FJAT-22058]KRF54411.1 cytochrome C assembly protein [Bacillus sp. Soil745]MBD8134823.1 cytochrome c biogenesis protein CcsA [Bacillus sp. CFBP 13597]MBL3641163.1 cytochrome c biogenesis protein CcsA [Bacillus sp. RHFB]MDP9739856.1 HemX protein [Bacillus sp. B2I3]MEC0272352.1 cytochrome c biogenesis protein [Per